MKSLAVLFHPEGLLLSLAECKQLSGPCVLFCLLFSAVLRSLFLCRQLQMSCGRREPIH